MTRIPSRPTKPLFHLRWLAYSKSSYGHQELWIHHLSTAENWKPVVLKKMIRIKGYQLLALTPCLMKWQKKLNCTNLSEHWEALQPTKLECTVLMVLAQLVKKKSHCMASLRSRTTHGCAFFSVFSRSLEQFNSWSRSQQLEPNRGRNWSIGSFLWQNSSSLSLSQCWYHSSYSTLNHFIS